MKPPVSSLHLASVVAALALMGGATAATAQAYRPDPPPPPPKATSSIEATGPTATETKEAKALTAAVFAKPAAAAQAVQKATADSQPDYAVNAPKPSPLPDGFRPGGKGVEIKAPF